MKHALFRATAVVAILVCHGYASADDPAAADALFKRAVSALKTGDLATACPAFAESRRLDPRPGTLVAIADCEADAGRIATAVTLYDDFLRTVASINSEKERQKYLERVKRAQKRRDKIAKDIPELTLELPSGAPANVRMTRNGEPFTATSLGLPIPVDPGVHVITVQLATGPVNEQRLTIGLREKQTIELTLPVVEAPTHVQSTPRRPLPNGGDKIVPLPPTSMREDKLVPGSVAKTQIPLITVIPSVGSNDAVLRARMRTTGIVLGGLGALGLATGIVSGSIIVHRKEFIDANCPALRCNAEGFDATRSLPVLNVTNAVGLALGGAALATGGVMFGWATHWFGLKSLPSETRVGVVLAGARDSFVGVKGVF